MLICDKCGAVAHEKEVFPPHSWKMILKIMGYVLAVEFLSRLNNVSFALNICQRATINFAKSALTSMEKILRRSFNVNLH